MWVAENQYEVERNLRDQWQQKFFQPDWMQNREENLSQGEET